MLRLNAESSGLRCIRCAASEVHLALGQVLRDKVADMSQMDVCELSASGPYVKYIEGNARRVSLSEFSEAVEPGQTVNGVRCEDVQCLTYPNECFDLVTHTEVLEHVPDDGAAFAELRRVLKVGGMMMFTVPMSGQTKTIERARGVGPDIEYLLEPVYHTDPWQRGAGILAYRDYGTDIIAKLDAAGFERVEIIKPKALAPWYESHEVILARRS
ncbi:class I SAM-dependent methyltransferase [Dokdonella sp.]|uniref:class I SAM-dependent methyltransferase n=1 Tax=Dokdonella sp. TaxID=2291710 RepID=UPI003C6F2D14